jgi:hypothetical protein
VCMRWQNRQWQITTSRSAPRTSNRTDNCLSRAAGRHPHWSS